MMPVWVHQAVEGVGWFAVLAGAAEGLGWLYYRCRRKEGKEA